MAEVLDPRERVVITGMGVVSPLGNGVEQNWQALLQGSSGITRFPEHLQRDSYAEKVQTVGLADQFTPDYLTAMTGLARKDLRRRHRVTHLALAAGAEALQQAGLAEQGSVALLGDTFFKRHVGVIVGSGASGADQFAEAGRYLDRGRLTPLPNGFAALPEHLATFTARVTGARGFSVYNSGACETGNMTFILAIEKLLSPHSQVDVVLAGSAEAQATPEALNIFGTMNALDKGGDPDEVSRPFHVNRGGFVMAEGAGMLVFERMSHAIGRGARILAEVTGWGESNDARLDTDTDPDGIRDAVGRALLMSREFEGITYVNAHATGTVEGDPVEMSVMAEMVDPVSTVITSTKANTGHILGGANAVETVFALKALNEGVIPPQIKIDEDSLIPEAKGLVPTHGMPIPAKIGRVVKNGFGFGGTNGSLVYQPVER